MSKKKVLFVVHQLNIGGVQKSLIQALNAVDYTENEVTLYVRKNRVDFLNEVNPAVNEIIINDDKTVYYRKPFAIALQILATILRIFGLKKLSEKFEKKLIDYQIDKPLKYEAEHYFKNKHFDIAVSYIQYHHAKLVADFVDADKKILFYHSGEDENHELHADLFKKYNNIVIVNENVKNILCKAYPDSKEKFIIINNYVDAEIIRNQSREETIDVPSDRTIICSCGRMAKEKGHNLSVKAASILKNKGYKFLWYIIGDGPEKAAIEELIAASELRDYFVLTGLKDNPYPYIAACDIFVQPSFVESYGLTIREAQALYKPVVTTSTIGGKLLVKNCETGIITAISAEGIADGIEKMMTDTALREKIKDNLSGISFHEEKEQYRKEYKDLLNTPEC